MQRRSALPVFLLVAACGTPAETTIAGEGNGGAAGTGGGGGSAGAAGGAGAGGEGGSTCGARVAPYTYERPYGDTAAWNVPACDWPTWSESDEYRDRFWYFSNPGFDPADPEAGRGLHGVDFGLSENPFNDFAPPVYDVASATTTRTVVLRANWGGTNLAPNETIPWNPAWRAMGGGDGVMILLDQETGQEWDLWGVVQTDPNGFYNDSECWLVPGYEKNQDLCVGSAYLVKRPDTNEPIDFRTYTGNFPSRGVKIQFYAGVVTPDEVAAGEIRHALMMAVANPQFGPACTDAELGTPAMGTTCGFSLAPAGGLEWLANCGACAPSPLAPDELRARAVPEGMRLALDLTDADIDSWLDERGYAEPLRSTARVFAVALRDYGWTITDTGGTATFAVSGSANPDTEAAWRALGIEGSGFDLLFGLVTRDRLRVLAPAENLCVKANGTTTPSPYGCKAAETKAASP